MLLLVLAAVAAYWNSLHGEFVVDDAVSILFNPTVRDLSRIDRVLSPPTGGYTVSGRPVLNLSIAINYALSSKGLGGRPAVEGFHLTNLLIHILAGLTLFGVVRRTLLLPRVPHSFARASTPLALACAAIWLVHPLQTEAVTYVIQRAESLVSLFYLLTLYATIRLATGRGQSLWCAGAAACCLAGMASKEVMVSAPLLVLLYDRAFLAGSFRLAWTKRWRLYVSLAATWALLAYLVASTGGRGETAGLALKVTPWEYARTQFGIILHYLRLAFWPNPLILDYSWPVATSWGQIVPPAIVILSLLGAVVWALVRRPRWALPGTLFFFALAPTSSIVPIADLAFEHRMYLPLAGLVTLIVVGGYALLDRMAARGKSPGWPGLLRLGVAVLVIAAVTALAWWTRVRNLDYRTELSIWQDTAAKNPRCVRAQYSAGEAARRQIEGIYTRAVLLIQESRQLSANNQPEGAHRGEASARLLLAQVRERLDLSERFNRRAVDMDPASSIAHLNLGHTFIWRAQLVLVENSTSLDALQAYRSWLTKGVEQYTEALRLSPGRDTIRQRLDKAREFLRDAERRLGVDPAPPPAGP